MELFGENQIWDYWDQIQLAEVLAVRPGLELGGLPSPAL